MHDYDESYTASTMMWRMAAVALMAFIKDNIRIIGFDEIESFNKAKKLYDEAKSHDKQKYAKRYKKHDGYTPPWIDRDWRHDAV